AGATVAVTNSANGIQLGESTDADGRYALPSLRVGTYEVGVALGRYKAFRQAGVNVTANTTQTVNAALEAGDADSERLALLDRIEELEKRLADLESRTVFRRPRPAR